MGTLSSGSSPIVTLFITSEDAKSERRFSKSLTVLSLKEKLEPITGVPAASMALSLYTPSNVLVANLSEDERLLGYYGAVDFMILQVSSTSTTRRRFEYSDVSAVRANCVCFMHK